MTKIPANKDLHADVIVVGGGLAGLTLSAILGTGADVICIDSADPARTLKDSFDGRTTAVSLGSRSALESACIWNGLRKQACPITDIRILDDNSPILLQFLSEQTQSEAFGWIIENILIRQALYKRIQKLRSVKLLAPAKVENFQRNENSVTAILGDGRKCTASLVIGADGRNSFTREWIGIGARAWPYRQRAIVCTAIHEKPHHNIAIEHFRAEGPFAVLPMTNSPDGEHRSSVVWTESGPYRASAIHFDQEVFNAALNARFPQEYGAVRLIGKRFSYPLGFIHAYHYTAPRMALIAEAAHGIHPIAGQGLNMGFRDISTLSALILDALEKGSDPGHEKLLAEYQRRRRADNMAMAGATDILNRLFSNQAGPLRLARQLGLRAVQHFTPARRFFMRHAMGLGVMPEKRKKIS